MSSSSDFSVIAIIAAYNEADIVKHVVLDLINQNIQVYFLDDGSDDGTVAAVEPYLGRGVLAIERLRPASRDQSTAGFDWERILGRKAELARELHATWFIHHDADEFREGPWPHLTLKEAIQRVDALGYNAIDFASFDFWPTHDQFRPGEDVRDAFTFYSNGAPYDYLQIRCWKQADDVDLTSTGGHEARFPDRRVFPVRFILRHYPIRGQAHGERKIFRERQRRFLERERARGWHVQYDGMSEGTSFVRDPTTLTPYDPADVRLALTLRHRGVESLEEALTVARADTDAVRHELDVRSREVRESTEALVQVRDELSLQTVNAETFKKTLEQRSLELSEALVNLEARTSELATQRAQLAMSRGEIERQSVDLAALHAAFGHRGVELEETRAQLQATALELTARTREIARLSAVLAEDQAEIARWRASLEDATRRLEAFEHSLSWRWTAPARAASRVIRGLARPPSSPHDA